MIAPVDWHVSIINAFLTVARVLNAVAVKSVFPILVQVVVVTQQRTVSLETHVSVMDALKTVQWTHNVGAQKPAFNTGVGPPKSVLLLMTAILDKPALRANAMSTVQMIPNAEILNNVILIFVSTKDLSLLMPAPSRDNPGDRAQCFSFCVEKVRVCRGYKSLE